VEQPHGARRDERRLLRGLGDHAIACGEGRRDLTHEDREREFHGLMQGEGAAPGHAQVVRLAGRAGQHLGRCEMRRARSA
jgi:hypothetical protein